MFSSSLDLTTAIGHFPSFTITRVTDLLIISAMRLWIRLRMRLRVGLWVRLWVRLWVGLWVGLWVRLWVMV